MINFLRKFKKKNLKETLLLCLLLNTDKFDGVQLWPVTINLINPYVDEKSEEVSDKNVKVLGDKENQKMIIRFFEGLEDFGIKFSENQKSMLISSANTLILGRSGTGKTTVSAFKILALDLLFMAYKKKVFNNKSYKLRLEDLNTYSGCSNVFCTASPVLTNEVKRFYNDLIS